jgi:O-antigen/teichoic acid export membrane protein
MTEANFPTDRAAGAIFLGALVGSLTIIALTVTIDLLVGPVRNIDSRHLALIFTGTVFYTGAKEIVNGTTNFGLNPWLEFIREIARIVLQVALVLLISDVAGMVIGLTTASLLLTPMIMRLSGVKPAFPTRKDLAEVYRFAKVSVPNGFVASALSQIDIIILGTLAGTAIVGNYRIAMNLLFPAQFVVATMAPGMMSRVSNLDSRDEDPSEAVIDGLSFVSVLAIPIAAGAIVVGDLVAVTVYSSEFSRAGLFIGWLGIYFVLQTQMRVFQAALKGLDRPDQVLKLNLVGFLVNAVLGLGLFFLIGAVGVVYATVVGIGFRYLLGGYWLRRNLDMGLLPTPLQHQLVAAVVMAAALYGIRSLLGIGSWLEVGGIVLAGGVFYGTVLISISREFRKTAVAIGRDGLNKFT